MSSFPFYNQIACLITHSCKDVQIETQNFTDLLTLNHLLIHCHLQTTLCPSPVDFLK